MNIETEKLIRVKASEDFTRFAISQPIYKEDYGLYLFIEGLELPPIYTVDFSNSDTVGDAVSMLGNADGVLIPQQFIKSGMTIFAFLYLTGNEVGKTVYKFKIPNRIRPNRTNEEPTPEEQSTIDQAIYALNTAVAQTTQDVASADASAQSASDSADRAEIAEQDAENAADVAHEYADRAETSASQASASATASAQSAQSASQSAQTAQDALREFTTPTASATTLQTGSDATASYANGHFAFGIPRGDDYVLTAQDKQDIAGLVDVPVDDVQINGTSILSDGVANVPIANTTRLGVVKIKNDFGIMANVSGELAINGAATDEIKNGTANFKAITAKHQHEAVFYGLATSSGDITQASSSNPVGTYTDDAKTAIRTMLDVPSNSDIPTVNVNDVQINGTSIVSNGVANIPMAGANNLGAVMVANGSHGLQLNAYGKVMISNASSSSIKGGSNTYTPITPSNQHESAFYGLAKSAGDTTQSASSNAVGNYTESAKSAIAEMLNGSVSVSGTTPTITAKSGIRYVCGEVSTLDITLPSSGIVDVVFESGSTATVLTITPPTGQTVKWANGFDPTSLDANTTYEINIMDGLGVAGAWT